MRFWDLVFLRGAGGPGNPCYGVQAHLVNFALHFQNILALCQSKATLPKLHFFRFYSTVSRSVLRSGRMKTSCNASFILLKCTWGSRQLMKIGQGSTTHPRPIIGFPKEERRDETRLKIADISNNTK